MELVEDSGGGVLVEPGDAESLADALVQLARDPQRRESLGRRGYEYVRATHDPDRAIDAHLELYRQAQQERSAWPT